MTMSDAVVPEVVQELAGLLPVPSRARRAAGTAALPEIGVR